MVCTESSKRKEAEFGEGSSAGPIGCASAVLGYWFGGKREIQTVDISFAQVCSCFNGPQKRGQYMPDSTAVTLRHRVSQDQGFPDYTGGTVCPQT